MMDILARARAIGGHFKRQWYASQYQFPRDYRRIYHYHVRKSAGTSLNAAFWHLARLDLQQMGRRSLICKNRLIFVRHEIELINEGHYFYASSHQPAYRLNLPAKTFTIVILRDPLARLLSYYRYLLHIKLNPQAKEYEPFYPEVLRESDYTGDSFQDFLAKVPRRHLSHQLYLFSENYDPQEAADRILQCSAICLTETFPRDLEKLAKTLDLPLLERRERSFRHEINLSDADLDCARDLLHEEFKAIALAKQKLNSSGLR